jgi:hypothetical protein
METHSSSDRVIKSKFFGSFRVIALGPVRLNVLVLFHGALCLSWIFV